MHHLTEKGVPFVDENDLRDKGYDKTPDIKLEVPAVINGEDINDIDEESYSMPQW